MSLRILNVAYPLAPVGEDAVGGAEQVLSRIDEALVAAGHESVVIACEGSSVAGTLIPVELPRGPIDDGARRRVHERCRLAIEAARARYDFDVVHLHGVDCASYLPPTRAPLVITLHLPPSWYAEQLFRVERPGTHMVCVSHSQMRSCPATSLPLRRIENGVAIDRFVTGASRPAKRGFVLALGRICPEKGFHLAIDAAKKARVPMILAGSVFGYEEHEAYFDTEIVPRIERVSGVPSSRFIGPLGFARKRRFLAAARALLVPSLVPETSSLVAMEALACGTPVVAFRSGALPEIVEHGRTGLIVETVDEMAEAIAFAPRLDPRACLEAARTRFSCERMTREYLSLYEELAQGRATRPAARASPPRDMEPSGSRALDTPPRVRTSIGSRELESTGELQEVPRESAHDESADEISVESIESADGIEALRDEWWSLFARSTAGTPFQTPAWILSWWRHLGRGRPWVVGMRDRGRTLVGVVPLFLEETGRKRTLRLMGSGVSDYLGGLFADGSALKGARAFLAALASSEDAWDECILEELPEDSPLLEPFGSPALAEETAPGSCCPFVELSSGSSLEDIVSRQLVRDVAYARRRIARAGSVSFDRASETTFEDAFSALVRLHSARWRERDLPGAFSQESVIAFHREAAREMLSRDLLRLSTLEVDGMPIAAYYGFQWQDRAYYYASGFDASFARSSPGNVIVAHAIEEALDDGAAEFDLLRGREPYKYRWGARDRWSRRRTIRSRAMNSASTLAPVARLVRTHGA